MPKETNFKHISVSTSQEDEEVIVAGIVSDNASYNQAQNNDAAFTVIEEASSNENKPSTEAQYTTSANPKDNAESKSSSGDYHETTLEDITHSKMSTTQIIVIVCAILGIAAFIIWYIVGL